MAGKEKIGWVGLGKMGAPMAKNMVKAGFPLTVWNRTREKTGALAELGATVADSPERVASDSDVVISMILDDRALDAVSTGPEGIFKGARPGLIYIDMSTVSAVASARVAEAGEQKGVNYLRAPVIGGVVHAESGGLGVLASGPKDLFDRCSPLLAPLSKTSHYLGPKEEGRVMKLVLNMQVGIIAAMIGEALTFGEAGGVEWNQMIKDFDLVLDTGKATNAPMPIATIVRQLLGIMKAQRKGDIDFWQMVTLLEQLGGLKKTY